MNPIYEYKVKKKSLTDDELRCLGKHEYVLSSISPRAWQSLYCGDCQFPTGDTFVLRADQLYLKSAIASCE